MCRVGQPGGFKPTRLLSLVLLVCVAASACGKKGPPLPPLRRVPAAVDGLAADRYADEVFVKFTVPSTNVEGTGSANLAWLEVYAITTVHPLSADEVQTDAVRKLATLLATERVRPPLPPTPPSDPARPAPPPLPIEPGLDQGGAAVIRDTLAGAALEPIAFPSTLPKPEVPVVDEPAVPGPLVAPDAVTAPRRYYFVVGVTANGRYGVTSEPVAVPLGPSTSAPGRVAVAYDEQAFMIRWEPAADARLAEAPPQPDGLLPSRPIVAPVAPTKYEVYPADTAQSASGPVMAPMPLNAEPLTVPEFKVPGVAFGRERCFIVRPVDVVSGITVRGPRSAPSCVAPVDTFPPATPRNLQAVAGAGTISLIWEANSEPDLAGYIVLRGDAAGDTLTPLTPAPIRDPRFDDATVQPGVRYVYVVVAVDTASPRNTSAQSNRAEETAR